MIKGREILLYLSYKYNGEWDKIFDAVKAKEHFEDEDVEILKANLDSNYITIVDKEYPWVLKNVHKPPFVLYYHGDISLIKDMNKCLAVVGSRECSSYSKDNTIRIISELQNNFIIVSGMANGIDTIAHKSALANNGKTIAVLGCGINYIYPKTNKDLYEQIKTSGLIISEYPSKVQPSKDNFPFRNRLITGLSWGVFIPEVHERSGTMISIGHALSQNKDVLVMPQPVNNQTFNNHIIAEGACVVERGSDILNEKN